MVTFEMLAWSPQTSPFPLLNYNALKLLQSVSLEILLKMQILGLRDQPHQVQISEQLPAAPDFPSGSSALRVGTSQLSS